MAQRDNAKPWFVTGAKPTQAQFHQLLNWLRFKDEALVIEEVAGLLEALQTKANLSYVQQLLAGSLQVEEIDLDGDDVYELTAGRLLEKVIICPKYETVLSLGTGPGLEDIMPQTPIGANGSMVMSMALFGSASQNIYFTGIQPETRVFILARPITQF